MNTNKPKYTLFDKVAFPVLNTLMLVVVFVMLRELFAPSSFLEWTAVILICGLLATPIANMTRKDFKEHAEVEAIMKQEASQRKSA